MIDRLRRFSRHARLHRHRWIAPLDRLRALFHPEGRALLWVEWRHRSRFHQRSTYTEEERYPALFDAIAGRVACHARLLSFGCSTGAELAALRRRLPGATLVGADINPRARRIAAARFADDDGVTIVAPHQLSGRFDAVLALAVLQRDTHMVIDSGLGDLSSHYPFARFDDEVVRLANLLDRGGLMAVDFAHYRVEDSRAAPLLDPVPGVTGHSPRLFARDGSALPNSTRASALFVRR